MGNNILISRKINQLDICNGLLIEILLRFAIIYQLELQTKRQLSQLVGSLA